MRIVRSDRHEEPSSAPVFERLESVRYLAERFPLARLREVTLLRASDLDARADASGQTHVWLALESMQVTGSFKVRGALAALAARAANRGSPAGHVVTASAGNHGAGVANAAHVLGVRATIVMPRGVPETKRKRVEAYGAEVVLAASDHYDDAEAAGMDLAQARGCPFLSPYDDVDVVAGNGGSLGFEIVRALGRLPRVVLAPFGGGGLSTGLAWALARESQRASAGARRAPVWGVQSEASPVMALSLERREAVVRFAPAGETLAEGLEGGIAPAAFARARAAIAGVAVVSEEDIARAMVYAYREMGLVVEGSAATALAPLLQASPLPADFAADAPDARSHEPRDLVVVLTGRNVDRSRLERVLGMPPANAGGGAA